MIIGIFSSRQEMGFLPSPGEVEMNTINVLVVLALAITPSAVPHQARSETTDPLKQITQAFPGSLQVSTKRLAVEFCPDNTCDGFIGSHVTVTQLKDFAYLFIYFFSDFNVLQKWRDGDEPRTVAERTLSRPEYQVCPQTESRDKARCVLSRLSGNGRIRLLSIRYDENQRVATGRNLAKALAK